MSVSQCRNLGWGDDFVTCTLEFMSRLRSIAMDCTEFCILCAIVLTYPGQFLAGFIFFIQFLILLQMLRILLYHCFRILSLLEHSVRYCLLSESAVI